MSLRPAFPSRIRRLLCRRTMICLLSEHSMVRLASVRIFRFGRDLVLCSLVDWYRVGVTTTGVRLRNLLISVRAVPAICPRV